MSQAPEGIDFPACVDVFNICGSPILVPELPNFFDPNPIPVPRVLQNHIASPRGWTEDRSLR